MGARSKEDQQRVRTLLTDTVTLLCKNGLTFQRNMKIQGLLGITLDDSDVFLVHLNDVFEAAVTQSINECVESPTTTDSPSKSGSPSKKRRRSRDRSPSRKEKQICYDTETIDLDPDVEIKAEPGDIKLKIGKDLTTAGENQTDLDISCISGPLNTSLPLLTGTTTIPQMIHHPGGIASTAALDPSGLPSTSSALDPPYVTGFVRNAADNSNQSDSSSGFAWNSSVGPGTSSSNLMSWTHDQQGSDTLSQLHGQGGQQTSATGMVGISTLSF